MSMTQCKALQKQVTDTAYYSRLLKSSCDTFQKILEHVSNSSCYSLTLQGEFFKAGFTPNMPRFGKVRYGMCSTVDY